MPSLLPVAVILLCLASEPLAVQVSQIVPPAFVNPGYWNATPAAKNWNHSPEQLTGVARQGRKDVVPAWAHHDLQSSPMTDPREPAPDDVTGRQSSPTARTALDSPHDEPPEGEAYKTYRGRGGGSRRLRWRERRHRKKGGSRRNSTDTAWSGAPNSTQWVWNHSSHNSSVSPHNSTRWGKGNHTQQHQRRQGHRRTHRKGGQYNHTGWEVDHKGHQQDNDTQDLQNHTRHRRLRGGRYNATNRRVSSTDQHNATYRRANRTRGGHRTHPNHTQWRMNHAGLNHSSHAHQRMKNRSHENHTSQNDTNRWHYNRSRYNATNWRANHTYHYNASQRAAGNSGPQESPTTTLALWKGFSAQLQSTPILKVHLDRQGKVPVAAGYQNETQHDEAVASHEGNVGSHLSASWFVNEQPAGPH